MALDLNQILSSLLPQAGGPEVIQEINSESEGTKQSLRVSTSGASPDELAALIQQAAVLSAQQTVRTDQQVDMYSGSQDLAAGQGSNLARQGQLTRDIVTDEGLGKLNTQNARVKIANAYGTNANAQSDVITKLAEETRLAGMKLIESQNKVSDIESKSDLLGNPVGWLADLLVGAEFRARRDALADDFDMKVKVAQSLNSMTQQGAATQNAITETMTAGSIAKTAELAALEKQNQAAQARMEANKYGIAGLEALNRHGAEQFNRNFQLYQANRQEEQFAIMREEANRQRSERKKDEEYFLDATARINAYNEQFNLPTVNVEYVKRNLEKSNPVGEKLRSSELSGWQLLGQAGDPTGILGATAADAYQAITRDSLNVPPAWKGSVSILDQANQVLLEQQALAMAAKKDPMGNEIPTELGFTSATFKSADSVKLAYNKVVDQLTRQAQSNITHGTGNPYQVPPLPAIMASDSPSAQALKNSKFGQLVLGDLLTTETIDPAPELVIAVGMRKVDSGEMTFAELNKGLGDYLQEGVALKNATGGFGVTNVFGASSYNVSIDSLVGERVKIRDPNKQSVFTKFMGAGADYDPLTWTDPAARRTPSAPKPVFNLLDPQDRTTALTIIRSQEQARKMLDALKGTQP